MKKTELTTIIAHDSLSQIKNFGMASKMYDFPTKLFNPYRFSILINLYTKKFVSFSNLKITTRIKSDGNLASHLRYLEQHKFILIYKSFAGRYPKRFYFLTQKGKEIVEKLKTELSYYVEQLQ